MHNYIHSLICLLLFIAGNSCYIQISCSSLYACMDNAEAQTANEKPQSLIDNFREVYDDSYTGMTFSFDLFKGDSGGITTKDVVQLQWETANSSSRGFINLSVRTTAVANRYRFTVRPSQFGEDPLLLTLSIKLQCLRYNSYYCSLNRIIGGEPCICVQWQYQGDSETIQIGPKQGMLSIVIFAELKGETINCDALSFCVYASCTMDHSCKVII